MGGNIDHRQPGFDHWVSFKGQGTYWADGHGTSRKVPQNSYDGFNVNGKRVPQKGYITDELTGYSLDWLKARKDKRPFFLMISHKAVHADFVAADRHLGRYKDKRMLLPKTFANTKENYADKPIQSTSNQRCRLEPPSLLYHRGYHPRQSGQDHHSRGRPQYRDGLCGQ